MVIWLLLFLLLLPLPLPLLLLLLLLQLLTTITVFFLIFLGAFIDSRSGHLIYFHYILGGLSKTFFIIAIYWVSVYYYGATSKDDDFYFASEGFVQTLRHSKGAPILVILLVSGLLYEVGQLEEERWNIFKYFNIWNKLDAVGYLLIIIWLIAMIHNEVYPHPYPLSPTDFSNVTHSSNTGIACIGRISLSLSAIPMCLGQLQYFSTIRKFGELVIMIIAMGRDILNWCIVYFACILGFGMTFYGLFFSTQNFKNSRKSFVTMFNTAVGNIQYGEVL